MLKVKFKYRRKLEGKTYNPGVHDDVPDSVQGHWFFEALKKAGDVEVLGESPEPSEPKAEEKSETVEPVVVTPEALASEPVKEKEAPKAKKKKSS